MSCGVVFDDRDGRCFMCRVFPVICILTALLASVSPSRGQVSVEPTCEVEVAFLGAENQAFQADLVEVAAIPISVGSSIYYATESGASTLVAITFSEELDRASLSGLANIAASSHGSSAVVVTIEVVLSEVQSVQTEYVISLDIGSYNLVTGANVRTLHFFRSVSSLSEAEEFFASVVASDATTPAPGPYPPGQHPCFPGCTQVGPKPNVPPPTANGCSGVPDWVPCVYSFTNCCDAHDLSYSSCSSSKDQADSAFFACMTLHCQLRHGCCTDMYNACISAATIYYAGVRTLGSPYYCDAQTTYCQCVANQ